MEKKVLSIIGAIVALAGIAVAAYFIIEKLLRKSGYCCEELEFDNYVECPCDGDDDEGSHTVETIQSDQPSFDAESEIEE